MLDGFAMGFAMASPRFYVVSSSIINFYGEAPTTGFVIIFQFFCGSMSFSSMKLNSWQIHARLAFNYAFPS